MVTWGTSPEAALPITGRVPDPADIADRERRADMTHALDYMGLTPGTPLDGIAIDRVFIGSCTNSRIEDLRAAARVVEGRRTVVPAMVVPGSGLVKAQAEAEGLDRIFQAAGFEWRDAGCSMCVGMNGDLVASGERCASTSNRNFVGRQGRGARTHLVSPPMAAAAAVSGRLTAAPFPAANVDTDQIIPARFLWKARKDGFADTLFGDLRADGTETFVLDRPEYREARILVAERNFGCGSSREHAVWALWDGGFRAVIAPSFGDIFFNNSLKNGLLPIVLPAARVAALLNELARRPGARVAVDLAAQAVTGPDGRVDRFEIDPLQKESLLEGLDDIDLTLRYRDRLDAFERAHDGRLPWL